MKALYFDEFGDNSVLQYGEVEIPKISRDQLLIKTSYIGLNFADIHIILKNVHPILMDMRP